MDQTAALSRPLLLFLLLAACASRPALAPLTIIDKGIAIPPSANSVRTESGVVIFEHLDARMGQD